MTLVFSFFSMFQKACFLWFKLLRHILFMLLRILKASFLIQIALVSFSRVTFGRSIIWLFNSSTCEVIRPKLFKTVSLVEFLSWRQFSRNSVKNVHVSRKFSLRRISCSRISSSLLGWEVRLDFDIFLWHKVKMQYIESKLLCRMKILKTMKNESLLCFCATRFTAVAALQA